MKTVIYKSKFHETALQGILNKLLQVNPLNLMENHIVLVPDRFTLSVENLIYPVLKNKGAFNISVMTLSRLALKLNIKEKYISKFGAVMLMRKAIELSKPHLKCFTESVKYQGFCESMYETISKFKSCIISPETLLAAADKTRGELSLRLKDTAVIYKNFDELTQNKYIDSSGLASLIAKECDSNEHIKRSCFYVAGFDDMAKSEVQCFKQLIKNAKQCVFAFGCDCDDNCLNNITQAIRDLNADFTVIDINDNTDSMSDHLNSCLSTYSAKSFTGAHTKTININSHSSMLEEVEQTAEAILKDIRVKGLRLKDIAVITSDIQQYLYPIEKTFKSYNIPYYLSEGTTLSKTSLFATILSLINCVCDGCAINDVLFFTKSGYFNCEKDKLEKFENYCIKYGIDRSRFLQEFTLNDEKTDDIDAANFVRADFENFYGLLSKTTQTVSRHSQDIKRLITTLKAQDINDKMKSVLDDFGYKEESAVYDQVLDKISSLLNQLNELMENEVMTLKQYRELLIVGADSLKLSTVPFSADILICGDLESSRFVNPKALYVLGAVEGNFPQIGGALSIISQTDIDSIDLLQNAGGESYRKLRREHLKIRRLLCSPYSSLNISYVTSDDKGQEKKASDYVLKLSQIFKLPHNTVFNSKLKPEKVSLSTEPAQLRLANELFFRSKSVSISSLEAYCKCPRNHFFSYGLFLKPREETKLQSLDIGNFLHSGVELFLKEYEKGKDVKALAERCFNKIINQDIYKRYLNKASDIAVFEKLKSELVRNCGAIAEQIELSKFVPDKNLLEASFAENGTLPPMKLENLDLKLQGKIDRIDVYTDSYGNKYARIIDYKSGRAEYSESDLFLGNKIQLFIYMSVLEQQGYSTAGLYYFRISDKFETEESNPFALIGVTVNESGILSASDLTIAKSGKSKVLNLSLTASDDGFFKETKNLRSRDTVKNYLKYSKKFATNAAEEILQGNIDYSPAKACGYCNYTSICGLKLSSLKPRSFSSRAISTLLNEAVASDE